VRQAWDLTLMLPVHVAMGGLSLLGSAMLLRCLQCMYGAHERALTFEESSEVMTLDTYAGWIRQVRYNLSPVFPPIRKS
jgi:hypothetical protein